MESSYDIFIDSDRGAVRDAYERNEMRAKLSLSTFWVLRTFAARQAQESYKSCGELSGSGEMRSSRQSASNYAIDVKNR
jgi:hypothetical protein